MIWLPRSSHLAFRVATLLVLVTWGMSFALEAAQPRAQAPAQRVVNNAANVAANGLVDPFGFGIGGFGQRAVGGISINADGVLDNASVDALGKLAKARALAVEKIPAELNEAVPLRKVSLRRLEEMIAVCVKEQKAMPEEAKCLGGLLQIRYIFVYPEQKDVVLVGPAEGWKVDAKGNLVGATSGKPLMLLDDLIVALRTATSAAKTGITCSIDPTAEGIKQLQAYLSKQKTIGDPKQTAANIEQSMGSQQISFTGVPATSHFARVLVAADYRMKRLAMGFEPTPVRAIPSFLQMMTAGSRGLSNMMPRWWLEPRYDAVLRDSTNLAWELRGASVKAMTEEDFMSNNGQREHSGKANPLAQKWADKMTEHYDELAIAEPIFGELRNCMELAIVGALVARERLLERAGASLPMLTDESVVKPAEYAAPTRVDTKVSMLKKGHNWLISASGGVAIYPAAVIQKVQESEEPAAARTKATPAGKAQWCWN